MSPRVFSEIKRFMLYPVHSAFVFVVQHVSPQLPASSTTLAGLPACHGELSSLWNRTWK